jgi:hypothetical protein
MKTDELTRVVIDDDDHGQLDEDPRLIWSKVAPERPYPLEM